MTQLALKLSPDVYLRPGELRQPHMVPLSLQAIEIFQAAKALTGRHRYVIASLYPGDRPLSENTINAALRRLGYTGLEMTAHGLRALASTLLNESGKWNPDAIERALGHKTTDGVREAYHRGAHWAGRVEMAQWWSDYLDTLRTASRTV